MQTQARTLGKLIRRASRTQFGRDHRFEKIDSIADFQAAVPLRTYESLWTDYLKDHYPVFENLTWPGRIRFLALTSGTTQGATKYIPVSTEMAASNRKAARTMLAFHCRSHPDSRLFQGRLFFLGGSAELREAAPGVSEGDLSGIAAVGLASFFRPFAFAPGTGIGTRLGRAGLPPGRAKSPAADHPGERGPELVADALPASIDQSGKATLIEASARVGGGGSRGSEVRPLPGGFPIDPGGREPGPIAAKYACSEGFVAFGDPRTELLRLMFDHGVFYEFVPADELEAARPTRHWLGNVECGVNYAIIVSTCRGCRVTSSATRSGSSR